MQDNYKIMIITLIIINNKIQNKKLFVNNHHLKNFLYNQIILNNIIHLVQKVINIFY